MTRLSLDRRAVLGVVAGSLAAPAIVRAQAAWPSQPIKLIVPFTPGGSTDVLARLIGQKLEPIIGQPFVVENRPGAGGSIAAAAVAKAAPDGHTIMHGHIGVLAFNPTLYPSLPYDPATAFAPIASIATVPNILAVHPSVPATTVAEFLAYARANPGKLSYGSGGNGSAAHIATAYLAHRADLKIVHVPYRGTGPAVTDLTGGHIQMMLTGGPALLPLVGGGQLRALAVSSKARAPFAPDLPTLAESGIDGFEAIQWHGFVAPAGTPAPIVERLNREINAQLDSAEVRQALLTDGALALKTTPTAFAAMIASEIALWRDVIRAAGIRLG